LSGVPRAGTNAAVARTVVGTIPDFQRKESPAGKVQSLIDTKVDAENAVTASGNGIGRPFADSHKIPSHP
jgi:hypothetical protein